ncbi:lipid A-modifier LpxR family protein [Brevundimonas goettingensis]|nr:lipid A-modifier LpxR family protein [Brevundimonas goettingensis]
MKRFGCVIVGLAVFGVSATSAFAQSTLTPEWARAQEIQALKVQVSPAPTPATHAAAPLVPVSGPVSGAPVSGAGTPSQMARLNQQSYAVSNAPAAADFGPAIDFQSAYPTDRFAPAAERASPFAATSRSDVWREGDGYTDRLRVTTHGTLRRADGSPLPATLHDESDFAVDGYDVSYTRGWPVARGYTASGLEVSLTPHAGIGVGDEGGSAEAGATLKIGSDIERLVPRGSSAFGERSRWYVYAAGSGRAVGYNFARNRDGDYTRSGMSQERGSSFLGDASIGVAMRRGDMQTSFGVVYRELKADGIHSGTGIDREVSEGLVAFQFSIRPEH